MTLNFKSLGRNALTGMSLIPTIALTLTIRLWQGRNALTGMSLIPTLNSGLMITDNCFWVVMP